MVESPHSIPRHELVAAALALGVERPEQLSQEELLSAVQRASESPRVPAEPPKTSWFGVARHLVASVVEQGLNLPEAARAIRSVGSTARPPARPPLPTLTLAQIYLAQGHQTKAQFTLEQVIERQPDNAKAKALLARLLGAQEERSQSEPDGPTSAKTSPENLSSEGASPTSSNGQVPMGQEAGVSDSVSQQPASREPAGTAAVAEPSPPGVLIPPEQPRSLAEQAPSAGARNSSGSDRTSTSRRATEWDAPRDCLVLLNARGAKYLCWELTDATSKRLAAGVVKAVVRYFEPSGERCRVTQISLDIAFPNGARRLQPPPGAQARGMLMLNTSTGGTVLAVASEFELNAMGRAQLLWSPRPGQDDTEPAARAASQLAMM